MKTATRQKTRLERATNSVQRWRLQLGLTQAEAAELLGVVRRTYQGWEDDASPAAPGKSHRIVMAMHVLGIRCPDPWPE